MKKRIKTPFDSDAASRAVVKVGKGRGFVMEIAEPNPYQKEMKTIRFGGKVCRPPRFLRKRVVVTAAHCLPNLPPAHPWASVHKKTYRLLGLLDGAPPAVMAECVFVDPVADIAVLGEPDGQVFEDAEDAYQDLLERSATLRLGTLRATQEARGWLLSLTGGWSPCIVRRVGRANGGLWVTNAMDGIKGGMSGSPILLDNGRVVGVLSTSSGETLEAIHTEGGPHPLPTSLPTWMVQHLTVVRKAE